MAENTAKTAEILFVKCVKDGIPNRDPLRDSDARRLFGEEDGRLSLSDVSLKRDVRDWVQARYPDGGEGKNMFVFVRKEFTEDHKLLGRDRLAQTLLERAGIADPKKAGAEELFGAAWDARTFGVVFSVGGKAFNQVGPVQFGWAHSLHPAETKYVQGTVVMPSKDVAVTDTGQETGATQGTIWTTYTLPFAVFAMPAVVNAPIAETTGLSQDDADVLLEALWKGTLARQARGRGIQQPLLLVHVEYNDPFCRLGFLEEGLRLEPGREDWLGSQPPTSLAEVTLDVNGLADRLQANADKIQRIRVWREPQLNLAGELPGEVCAW